jgi:mevalonate kinase
MAPGKAILFGEHAVVYGHPAIAVPIHGVAAHATVSSRQDGDPGSVWIDAPNIGYAAWADFSLPDDPLQLAVRLALEEFDGELPKALELRIESDIPVASGMGSSAAVTVAILRVMATHFEAMISPERTAELAFEVEKLHHGTPSGIDNSVIAIERPIYFVMDMPVEVIRVPRPFSMVLADTGKPSATRALVDSVRDRWIADRAAIETDFRSIGDVTREARAAIEAGEISALGPLMTHNQGLLGKIGVSSPELERLIDAAVGAGALGAKLSGAGGGGTMIALVEPDRATDIENALVTAGASRIITSEVGT